MLSWSFPNTLARNAQFLLYKQEATYRREPSSHQVNCTVSLADSGFLLLLRKQALSKLPLCHRPAQHKWTESGIQRVPSSTYEGDPPKWWGGGGRPNPNALFRRSGIYCSYPTSFTEQKDEGKEGKPGLPQRTGTCSPPRRGWTSTSSWKSFALLSKPMFQRFVTLLTNYQPRTTQPVKDFSLSLLKALEKKSWWALQAPAAMPAKHIHLTRPSTLWSCPGKCFWQVT